MRMRYLAWPMALLFAALLGGCGERDDPQAALERTVQQLQDNLEAKQNNAVLELLHPEFRAQRGMDRDWARRTMALLFLRHRNIQVIALGKRSWIDPAIGGRGYSEAQLGLSGAEGLIPDSARHYSVRLEWWREGDDWKLARLDWH